jgi:hypothetical protein
MNTITIEIGDVVGRRLYVTDNKKTSCLLLCAIRHRLELELDPRTVEVLELANKDPQRLRLRVKNAKCRVRVTTPDFASDNTPDRLKPYEENWPATADGHVVVGSNGANRYEIEVGELTVSGLKNAKAWVLMALWPSTPERNAPWTYVWSALGLAIQSQLRIDNVATIETLLLPKLESQDVAWANDLVAFWRLDGQPDNNAIEMVGERFSSNSPDGDTWPGTEGRKKLATCARRWRVLDTRADGFVYRAFYLFKKDAFLDLQFHSLSLNPYGDCQDVEPGLSRPSEPAMMAELWSVDEMQKAQARHVPRGAVVTLLRDSARTTIRWNEQGRRSVFDAALAHSSLSIDASNNNQFQRVSVSLTTQNFKPTVKMLKVNWIPGSGAGPAVSEVSSTPMKFAAVAPSLDVRVNHQSESVSAQPRWLATAQGWIDLPELASRDDVQKTSKLLKATSYAAQVIRGGVPLGEIGGPAGLSAWAVEGGREQNIHAAVRLRLMPNEIVLELSDAVLVWRTPAWWVRPGKAGINVQDTAPVLPDFSATFGQCFSSADATPTVLSEQLTQAIAEHFSATLWVGLTGPKTFSADDTTWLLEKNVNQIGTFLTLPAALAKKSTVWTSIKNAYLLNTRPNAGTPSSALLLDNNRALTPLVNVKGDLKLELTAKQLPAFTSHLFPSLEGSPINAMAIGGEMFHPNIFGLGYLPTESRLQYRHGPPILVDGWLRQHEGSGTADEISAASLETLRPVDDVAIYRRSSTPDSDRFSARNGVATETLVLKGWLPGADVTINSLSMQYTRKGKEDPALSMQINIGKLSEKKRTITIGSSVNVGESGSLSIEHNDDLDKFWLEFSSNPPSGSTGNFVNFGQSLAVSRAFDLFADGANKRWKPWNNAQREVSEGASSADRITFTTYTDFRLDGVTETWPIGVSLLDGLIKNSKGQLDDQVWDLVGSQHISSSAQAPCVGPFAILPGSLIEFTRASVRLTVRVAPPSINRQAALASTGGEVDLLLSLAGNGTWNVTSGNGTFDWNVSGSTFADQDAVVGLERIEGLVEMVDANLKLTVTSITLSTSMGRLRFSTEPKLINVQPLDSGGYRIELTVQSVEDKITGFSCRFDAICECDTSAQSHWSIEGFDPKPTLLWKGTEGTLTLPFSVAASARLEHLQVHTASKAVDMDVALFQSSTSRWGIALGNFASGSFAVAASIEVNQDGKTPRLDWTVRASALLDAGKLFGPCDPLDQHIRADVYFGCTGPLNLVEFRYLKSTLTGRVQFKNDFRLQSTHPASTFEHHVCLVFDQLKLSEKGTLPGSGINAVALHCLEDGKGQEVRFQSVHQIRVEKAKSGTPCLKLTCLLLLSPSFGDEKKRATSSQIRLFGDPEIAIARAIETQELIRGHVVRLAFRNTGIVVALNVQDTFVIATQDQLRFYPRLATACSPVSDGEDTEVWHERGALAELLSPAALGTLASSQRPAGFSQGELPVTQDLLIDWSPVLSGNGICLFDAALFTEKGVQLAPFVVEVIDVRTIIETSTIQAVRLELLSLEPFGTQLPLSCIASSLVTVTNKGVESSVQDWARQEMKRLSSRGGAIVVVRGRPDDVQAVHRLFQVAAISDVETSRPLPVLPAAVSRYSLAEATQDVHGTGWQGRMQISTQELFTIEALSSAPLVKDAESARLTRVASPATWIDGVAAQRSMPGALTFHQSVHFQQDQAIAPLRTQWPVFIVNAIKPTPAGCSVIAPVVDVTQWTVRPGDMLSYSFSMSGPQTVVGPAVTFQLRNARGNNALTDQTLKYKGPVGTHWDGVDWRLHRISSQTIIGDVKTNQSKALLLSIATVRDVLHIESDLVTAVSYSEPQAASLNLTWRQRKRRKNQSGKWVDGYSYNDPILIGVFIETFQTMLAPVELALVTHADQVFASTDVFSVADILNNPAPWQDHPELMKCLTLRQWSDGIPQQAKAINPTEYDASIASKLQQLLDLTDIPLAGKTPWLLSVQAGALPRMALVSRDASGTRRVISSVPIEWQDATLAGQPERLMVVSSDRVVGYGDLSGKAELSIDRSAFVLNTTCLALDQQSATSPLDVHAWRFSPGGVCTGKADS